jgi:hypothetical protein
MVSTSVGWISFFCENFRFWFFERVERTTLVFFKISQFYFLITTPIFKNSKKKNLTIFKVIGFQVFEPPIFRSNFCKMIITNDNFNK